MCGSRSHIECSQERFQFVGREFCDTHIRPGLWESAVGPDTPADAVAVVTLPDEVFVEIILTISNDVDCYVPTKKAFTEGSYEVTNCPYQPGVGEALAD